MENKKNNDQFVIKILLAGCLVIFFLMIKPFLPGALFALLFALTFYPVCKYLQKKFKLKSSTAGLLTTLIIVIIIGAPLGLIIGKGLAQASTFLSGFADKVQDNPASYNFHQLGKSVSHFISEHFGLSLETQKINDAVVKVIKQVSHQIYQFTPSIVSISINTGINLFFFVVLCFLFLSDGSNIYHKLYRIIPLNQNHTRYIMRNIRSGVISSFNAIVLIGLAQGALFFILFLFLGIDDLIQWSLIALIFSFVPFIGSPTVYVLTASIYFFQDEVTISFIILAYGIAIISTVDNFIRAFVVKGEEKISPILMFIGVIGGAQLFGALGIFWGPIFIILLLNVYSLYAEILISEKIKKDIQLSE